MHNSVFLSSNDFLKNGNAAKTNKCALCTEYNNDADMCCQNVFLFCNCTS